MDCTEKPGHAISITMWPNGKNHRTCGGVDLGQDSLVFGSLSAQPGEDSGVSVSVSVSFPLAIYQQTAKKGCKTGEGTKRCLWPVS